MEYHRDIYNTFNIFNLFGEDLWGDFEANLVNLDEEALAEYYSDSLVSYAAEKWSDSYHHEFQFFIEEETSRMTYGLKSAFLSWILSLDNHGKTFDNLNDLLSVENNKYINFNYTNLLEYNYGINESDIFYIHGKAENTRSELILGHGVVGKKADSYNIWNSDARLIEAGELIDDYYANTTKSSSDIISSNQMFFNGLKSISDVFVLGHSISFVDKPYFIEIMKKVGKYGNWHVSYYDGYGKMKAYNALRMMGLTDAKIHQLRLEEI
jgi:hypothetical protein